MSKNCVEVGTITQTRGLKGYVVARIEPTLEPTDLIKYIFVKIKHTLVPYQVEEIIDQGHQAFIKFQHINDQATARELIGTSIWLPKEILDKLIVQEETHVGIIGYQVTDVNEGELGIVKYIEQFPLHACLVIDYHNKELLIPYEPALIQHLDHKQKQLIIKLPVGFLEAVGCK
jgi:16S rRNA processing protein RimM